ncbi:MAG: hypothetical protein RMM28_07265 [Thermoleophilia bacterium]|nr:hypothetical protein [Gaiellaceae bacterium]MDW8338918.1 hypothetical protein [Thermoleophilia bacterium]
MSVLEPSTPHSRARRRRGRRGEPLRRLALLLALVAAFLLGIAFAETLAERPRDGGMVTSVRTLTPLPQQPPARTVTVTVTSRA